MYAMSRAARFGRLNTGSFSFVGMRDRAPDLLKLREDDVIT